MIDLNILEKGEDYRGLKKSFVIFVCTFDLFGQGRHVYTFENRCVQDLLTPLKESPESGTPWDIYGTAFREAAQNKKDFPVIPWKMPKEYYRN